jgi:hypothetical protein
MKNIISLLFLFLLSTQILAQNKRDYNWLFGSSPYYDISGVEGNIIRFKNNLLIDSVYFYDAVAWNNSNISDLEGNLLFYFNGCRIIDSSQNIMTNGDSINYGNSWEKHCGRIARYPGTQNSLILPDPGYEDGYYLIHKRLEIKTEPYPQSYNPELYYSYIDMQKNNGLGKVLEKNKAIFKTYSLLPTFLNACKHANEKDWWIIDQKRDTNMYFKVLLTSETIMPVDSQTVGPILTDETGFGQAVFSPDGATYLLYTKTEGALIYDFDRDSGQLSNFRQVMVQDSGRFVGAAISPNSRYAYLCAKYDLYQVDLWADDIQSTLTHIDHIDGFKDPNFLSTFNQAQLAPDCKIYIVSSATNNYLHVINSPDEKGKDCDFKQHSVCLPNRNFNNSIPNFPHFRIDEEDICDPTITWIPDVFLEKESTKMLIYPNPASDELQIHVMLSENEHANINLLGSQGTVILKKRIDEKTQKFSFDVRGLNPGIYYVSFISSKGCSEGQKIIITN